MRHTVRICMAAYNTADFIGEAFASVVRQRPDCELFFVCVDDGSDPGQSARIRELFLRAGFEKGHAVLKRLDSNGGVTKAWRECANYFRECEYTTWLDSDDYYSRDDVFSDVAALADRLSPDCIAFRSAPDEEPVDTVEKLADRRDMFMWCKCVKTEFVPPFSDDATIAEDLGLHMRICDSVGTVAYAGRQHVFHRDSPLSNSGFRRYGAYDSARRLLHGFANMVHEYRRPFVTAASMRRIRELSARFLDTARERHCEAGSGCSVVVPYPSVECMPADELLATLDSIRGRCVVDGAPVGSFVVPCGSKIAYEALSSSLSAGGREYSVDARTMDAPAPNGTSAMFAALFDCANRLLPHAVALIPPWWRPTRGVDLSAYAGDLDDSVLSIELAGWPWSECGGYMNYRPRDCGRPGYRAVQSHHVRDPYVFDASVPQVVNAAKLVSGFTEFFRQEQEFVKRLNQSNYWGRDGRNMVLVPDGGPMFEDFLGTNPAYRPVKEKKNG